MNARNKAITDKVSHLLGVFSRGSKRLSKLTETAWRRRTAHETGANDIHVCDGRDQEESGGKTV
jgi:hypothetical protein